MTVDISDDHASSGVAAMFNSAVAAFAISAAWELGALDKLRDDGELDVAAFAQFRGLDVASTVGMFRALASVHVVERDDTKVTVGRHFDEVYRNRSFFHFATRGCGELFRQMPSVLVKQNRVGKFYRRDPAAIAYACREINQICYQPAFLDAMDRLDFEFTRVVDLGCGSGGRVIDSLNRILELELAGVVRYMHYSFMIFGHNRIPIVAWLRA